MHLFDKKFYVQEVVGQMVLEYSLSIYGGHPLDYQTNKVDLSIEDEIVLELKIKYSRSSQLKIKEAHHQILPPYFLVSNLKFINVFYYLSLPITTKIMILQI